MPSATIRVRLTAWYGGVLMLTLVGLGIAVYLLMARALLVRVDAMLDFEFEEAAERLAEGHPAGELTDAPSAFHETYFLRIQGPDGEPTAQSHALSGQVIPALQWGGSGGPPSHVSAVLGVLGPCRVVGGEILVEGRRRVVQIATSLDGYEGELADLRGVLWTILPGGLLAATTGGYWLAGRSLAPVQRMTEAARRISAVNLGERIALSNPGDELGRLGATLNAMLDRIDRAFAATLRFNADAAHELRTPLASIRTEAEVALLARRRPEDYQETLRSVVEEADRLARLADRLLLLSREDSGQGLDRRPVRLDHAAREAARDALEPARRAGLTLLVEAMPAAEVDGDPDLLRQVFDNLLDNAVKYTGAGGTVTMRGHLDGGLAVVEVIDTGIGIPEEALPRVFDRFYRVDPSRSRRSGGTGLGLSIARAAIERHGGTIAAASTVGLGSTFRAVLPAIDPESMLK